MLTKKKRTKKEEKISKGKSLPGKNVSKKSQITQVDGNDDDPGEGSSKAEDTSKATKRPARDDLERLVDSQEKGERQPKEQLRQKLLLT